jgi:hypothetical protein
VIFNGAPVTIQWSGLGGVGGTCMGGSTDPNVPFDTGCNNTGCHNTSGHLTVHPQKTVTFTLHCSLSGDATPVAVTVIN